MSATSRRKLDFHTGDELIAEIERLRCQLYQKTKNWNLTQICEHLTYTMNGGMEGFGFRLPWIMRATVIKWILSRVLRTRKMTGGPTLGRLKPKSEPGPDDDAIIDHCIETIRKAKTFDGSLDDYPLLDNLKHDDWRQFMWMHGGHHLGFLVPSQG